MEKPRAGFDARLLLLGIKNKKVVKIDAITLLDKIKIKKKKNIKYKIVKSIEQPNYMMTPKYRRVIFGKFDDKCKFFRKMAGKSDLLFASCVNSDICEYVHINNWLSDYGINCENCRFKKYDVKEKIKWVKIKDYYKISIDPYYKKIMEKKYLNKLHSNSIVVNLLTNGNSTYCYVMLHNIPFIRII